MAIEIEFRGKRKDNGEWVYGDIIHHRDGKISICPNPCRYGYGAIEGFAEQVDRDTIGRFIGIWDKEGVKVYEGDKILWEEEEWKILYEWIWYAFTAIGEEGRLLLYEVVNVFDQDGRCSEIEVIGNIHDNLELQEGECLTILPPHKESVIEEKNQIIEWQDSQLALNKETHEEMEAEIKRLRKTLCDIAGAEGRIVMGFTADGEGTAHTVLPSNPYGMQEVARKALEGGGE